MQHAIFWILQARPDVVVHIWTVEFEMLLVAENDFLPICCLGKVLGRKGDSRLEMTIGEPRQNFQLSPLEPQPFGSPPHCRVVNIWCGLLLDLPHRCMAISTQSKPDNSQFLDEITGRGPRFRGEM